jgi:hypothetical protein
VEAEAVQVRAVQVQAAVLLKLLKLELNLEITRFQYKI